MILPRGGCARLCVDAHVHIGTRACTTAATNLPSCRPKRFARRLSDTAPQSGRDLRLEDGAVAEEAEDVGGGAGGDENFFAVDSFAADGNRIGL